MSIDKIKHDLAKRMVQTTSDHLNKKISDSEYEISLRNINNDLQPHNLSRNEVEVYAMNNREQLLKELQRK